MRRKNRLILWVLSILLLVGTPVYANEEAPGSYMGRIGKKFGRGVWNLVTSPAEIPCTIRVEVKDPAGAGAWTGFGIGSWNMIRRMMVGTTEVITFMIPRERTIPPVCEGRSTADLYV